MANINRSLSIMCFAWNASGLRLCETLSRTKADEAREGIKGFVLMKQSCVTPEFFEPIRGLIYGDQPDIVAMTTEDEDSSRTYFHSDLLPKQMTDLGYSLAYRDNLDKVGNVLGYIDANRIKSGVPSGTALRISLYIKSNIVSSFRVQKKEIFTFFSPAKNKVRCSIQDRASGAIGVYIEHATYGKFLFIATRLADSSDELRIGDGTFPIDYETYRASTRAANTLCIISIMTQLIGYLPEQSKPDHIILMGDLNYDIVVPGREITDVIKSLTSNISAANLKQFQAYDELKRAKEEIPLLGFKEGVSNEGPLFLPTWKLNRDRSDKCDPKTGTTSVDPNCFNINNKIIPSRLGWHDRILYKEMMTSKYILHCTNYNRLDVSTMRESDHAGVIASFELRPLS